jgi:hypothetical protein
VFRIWFWFIFHIVTFIITSGIGFFFFFHI